MKASTIDRKIRDLKAGERVFYPSTQLSNAEYHKVKAVSSSVLKDLVKHTPAYVYFKHVKKLMPYELTPAFLIGGATHKLVLETRSFDKEYIVLPEDKSRPTDLQMETLKTNIEKGEIAQENINYWKELDEYNNSLPMAGELETRKKPTPAQLKILNDVEELEALLKKEDREAKKPELAKIAKALDIQSNVDWWAKYNEVVRVPEEDRKRPVSATTKTIEKAVESKDSFTYWSEFDEKAKGKDILTPDQYKEVDSYRNAIRSHPQAGNLVKNGIPEQSVFWRDEETGLLCKARADYRIDNVLIDIKTTNDSSPRRFADQCAKLSYNLQQSMYMDGFEAEQFAFIAIEKTKHNIGFVEVYTMDDDFLDTGNVLYRDALKQYAECLKTGIWGGYNDGIGLLKCPNWYANQHK